MTEPATPDPDTLQSWLERLSFELELPDGFYAELQAAYAGLLGPALRQVLERAAISPPTTFQDERLLLRAVHLIGQARDPLACAPLLALLQILPEDIERLLGSTITLHLAQIVIGVFDGDSSALLAVAGNRKTEDFVRGALLGAIVFLTWEGRIDIAETAAFLIRFDDEQLAGDYDFAWSAWAEGIALLGLRDLAPRVEHAFGDDRVDQTLSGVADFKAELARAEAAPRDPSRFIAARLGYLGDAAAALNPRLVVKPDAPFADVAADTAVPAWLEAVAVAETKPKAPRKPRPSRAKLCSCGSGKAARDCCGLKRSADR